MKKRMGMLVFVLIVCAALGLTLLACDSSEQSGYSVAFEANGGSAVESLSGVTEVAEAPSSVRTGYTLEGWYLASDLSGEAVTFPLTVTADTTLYAKWSANTYTVSFDYTTADGGIGESSMEGTYGSALGTLPAPTMTGYTFAGWYDGDTLYTADSLMPAGDLELSAVFAANTYRLTFDTTVEGLTVEDVSVTFAAAVPALPVPEREGYTFLGWWDADGDKFEAGAPYNTVGDTALTARWEQITFTVTAVVGYEGGADKPVSVAYGTTIGEVLDIIGYVSRPGYKQPDWYLDAEFANEVDEDAKLTAETSIYAKWEAETYYLTFSKWELREGSLVLFESAGENYDFTVTVTYGQPIGDLPGVEDGVYVPAGFTFTGWGRANPSNTGERNNPVEEDTVWTWTDSNQTNLKPGYERITYTLTLDAGEGAFAEGGSTVTVPAEYYTSLSTLLAGYTPAQDGKTFGGWAYDGETVDTTGFYTWTQDITLTAVWIEAFYTVTLDYNDEDATPDGSIEVDYLGTFGDKLPTPQRDGFEFLGWEYIEGDTVTAVTSETVFDWTSDITLVAKWQELDSVQIFYTYDPATQSYAIEKLDTSTGANVYVPVYEGDSITSLTIPATYDDGINGEHPVTKIGLNAFKDKANLKELNLPNTITALTSANIIAGTGITELVVPASVTKIGLNTFKDATALEKLTFECEESSKMTANFSTLTSLKELTLPANFDATSTFWKNVSHVEHIYIPAAEGQKYVSNADGTQITDTSTGTVIWTSPTI